MIKVIMHGCNGKMGQVITELLQEDETAVIVAGIDRCDGKENGYPVYKSMKDCDITADVIIDFSSPLALESLLKFAIERKLPIVLCTTGLSKDQSIQIDEASKQIAILKSANMSLGVNTLMKLAQIGARVLSEANFDIEIVEKHHNQKVDAPSGTALWFADALNSVLEDEYKYVYDRSNEHTKRGKKEIGISSVRGGSIVGEHEIIFAGIDEVIELKHTAYSKAIFAKGAIQGAKFLANKQPGMYSMTQVVEES